MKTWTKILLPVFGLLLFFGSGYSQDKNKKNVPKSQLELAMEELEISNPDSIEIIDGGYLINKKNMSKLNHITFDFIKNYYLKDEEEGQRRIYLFNVDEKYRVNLIKRGKRAFAKRIDYLSNNKNMTLSTEEIQNYIESRFD